MVGVIVKVIISREHSLTSSRLGETWKFKKKITLDLHFVDIVKESLFPHNCLCNFCLWTSLHIRTMAKKEHLLIQTDDMLLSESYKNIQYNFLTNQFILF